mmetsp:Transcript_2474/g.4021  ORF Transcript_2474/g.4021 Transcript_2474/m.4021 type:complete len:205 (-) Transcript_2474:473-1087(-)
MRGCSNHLYPSVIRPVVRIASLERRKETVMNVDGVRLVTLAEIVRKDLHVPRKHNGVNVILLEEILNLILLPQLCLYLLVRRGVRILHHRQVVEGNFELLSNVAERFVVAYNEWYFAFQLVAVLPQQNIVKAVVELGHQDCHSLQLICVAYAPLHVEARGDTLNRGLQSCDGRLRVSQVTVGIVEVDPLKEEAGVWTRVLVRLE